MANEQLDITGLTGVTDAQRHALLVLGTIDRSTESDPQELQPLFQDLGIAA